MFTTHSLEYNTGCITTQPASKQNNDQPYTQIEALLEELNPALIRMARGFTKRIYSVSLDAEDLEQEGRLAIWKHQQMFFALESQNHQIRLGMKCARCAMIDEIRRASKEHSTSLEEHLTGRKNDGEVYLRELVDTPHTKRLASPSQRQHILAALDQLLEHQRLAIMAAYAIEDRRARVISPDDPYFARRRTPLRTLRTNGLRHLRVLLDATQAPNVKQYL